MRKGETKRGFREREREKKTNIEGKTGRKTESIR